LKEEVWTTLGQLIPQMLKAGVQVPPEVFKFSPLPTEIANAFMKKMSGQLDPQVKAKMDEMQGQLEALAKERDELKQQAQIKIMQNDTKERLGHEKAAVSMQDIQARLQESEKEHQREMVKMFQEFTQKQSESNDESFRRWEALLKAHTQVATTDTKAAASIEVARIAADAKEQRVSTD
jgi:DNA anti-recombination protein RmuC